LNKYKNIILEEIKNKLRNYPYIFRCNTNNNNRRNNH
jgi:hypothetical protein